MRCLEASGGAATVYLYEGVNGTTYDSTSAAPKDAGEYRVTVTGITFVSPALDSNYNEFDLTGVSATLTINKRTLTLSAVKERFSFVANTVQEVTTSISGWASGEEGSVYTTEHVYTQNEIETSPIAVGEYHYVISASVTNEEIAKNYNAIASISGTLTIADRLLIFIMDNTVAETLHTYDGTDYLFCMTGIPSHQANWATSISS